MASLKRRLRVVLLLVLMVLPITIAVVLFWFVSSDTWAKRVSTSLSQRLQMQVSLDDIALASTTSHRLSNLRINSKEHHEHFQIDEVYTDRIVEGEQALMQISADQWRWFLREDSDICLLKLIKQALPYLSHIDIDLKNGRIGSLEAALQFKRVEQKLYLNLKGALDVQGSLDLVKTLHATQLYDQLPAFVFKDTFQINDLSLEFDINKLQTQWRADLQWEHGRTMLVYMDDFCQVIEFSDTRLPLFVVQNKQLHFFGNAFESLRLGFDQGTDFLKLQLGDGDAAWFMHVHAAGDKMICRMESGKLIDVRQMFQHHIPQWLLGEMPNFGNIGGSSWDWNENKSLNGRLQFVGKDFQLRGDWALSPELQLDNVLLAHPKLNALASIDFSKGLIHCRSLQITKSAHAFLQLWNILSATGCYIDVKSLDPSVRVHDKQEKSLAQYREGQWSIEQLTAEQCNKWLGFDMCKSGHLVNVKLKDDAQFRMITGTAHDMTSLWPIADWDCSGAAMRYEQNGEKRTWILEQSNAMWQYDVLANGSAGIWKLSVPLFGQDWYIELNDGQMAMEKR